MNHIDDERVQFYLKHEQQIAEWAALQKTTRTFVHGMLFTMVDDLGELAEELGPDVRVHFTGADASEVKILLCREAWMRDQGRKRRLGIGLGWDPRQVTLSAHPRPYMGLCVVVSHPGGQQLRQELGQAVTSASLNQGYTRTSWWVAWRYAPAPTGEFWEDLGDYRASLVDMVRQDWLRFVDVATDCEAAVGERDAVG
jgi:hypothetical protein